jgi:hypothetical protein
MFSVLQAIPCPLSKKNIVDGAIRFASILYHLIKKIFYIKNTVAPTILRRREYIFPVFNSQSRRKPYVHALGRSLPSSDNNTSLKPDLFFLQDHK